MDPLPQIKMQYVGWRLEFALGCVERIYGVERRSDDSVSIWTQSKCSTISIGRLDVTCERRVFGRSVPALWGLRLVNFVGSSLLFLMFWKLFIKFQHTSDVLCVYEPWYLRTNQPTPSMKQSRLKANTFATSSAILLFYCHIHENPPPYPYPEPEESSPHPSNRFL